MRNAAAAGLMTLLLAATAADADPAPKRDSERACIATSFFAIDQGMMSTMRDDALVDMMCSTAIIATTNAMEGQPYAECDKLRLALAQEAKRRGLDLKAIGQKCIERIDSQKEQP